MAAETGSGKTGAFCLPILQTVWETLRDIRDGKSKGGGSTGVASTTSWKMSIYDRNDAMAITPDGLRCQSREFKEWHGCRATIGVRNRGKYCFEALVCDEGLCRVGWSTQSASLDLGTDRFSFGFGGTGKKSHNRQFDDYGEAFGKNDVITCLLDLEKNEVSYQKNGVNIGVAFRINDNLRNETFYPAIVLKNAEVMLNFGDTPFKNDVPAGYVACAKADSKNIKANAVSQSQSQSQQSLQPKPNAPQAIIIEPSRELAEQTLDQIHKFKKYLKEPFISELLVIGKVPIREQIEALKNGVDIVVATPGRLEELINSEQLLLTHCRFFVLDEADGLLKANYGNFIENIHKRIPKITSDLQRLQMIVCSATLHSFEVKKMADKLMHFPTWIDLKGEDAVPETVHHVVCIVDPQTDISWQNLRRHIQTDGVHAQDGIRPGVNTPETFSEAIKMLKGEYCIRAINDHNMDR